MPRAQKDPLRRLTAAERRDLGRLRRSRTAPAAEVTRANRLVFGLLVSALFVGSAFLWAMSAPPLVAGTSAFGTAGCFVSCAMGYRLFRAIQKSGRLEDEQP